MTDERKDKKKQDLLRFVSQVEEEASKITSQGREIVKQGQFTSDVARYTKQFIEAVPDGFFSLTQWDAHTNIWQNALGRAKTYKDSLGDPMGFALIADSTATSSTTIITSSLIVRLPPETQGAAQKAYEGFEQTLEHANIRKDIDTEINRLGLIALKNTETIASLLIQAEQAFTTPSVKGVSPSAVLIPLREAIEQTYTILLRRRPLQEPVKGDSSKVRSICKQCSHTITDSAQIELLAGDASQLKDLLSGAKQDSLSRDVVRELLNRGLIYLRTLLRTLDVSKIK